MTTMSVIRLAIWGYLNAVSSGMVWPQLDRRLTSSPPREGGENKARLSYRGRIAEL
jgi:hypothetical protein